eukprot:2752516-Rhodomonas_salina.1
MPCAVLASRTDSAIAVGVHHAMSGTDIAYDATRRTQRPSKSFCSPSLQASPYALLETDIGHGLVPSRCITSTVMRCAPVTLRSHTAVVTIFSSHPTQPPGVGSHLHTVFRFQETWLQLRRFDSKRRYGASSISLCARYVVPATDLANAVSLSTDLACRICLRARYAMSRTDPTSVSDLLEVRLH